MSVPPTIDWDEEPKPAPAAKAKAKPAVNGVSIGPATSPEDQVISAALLDPEAVMLKCSIARVTAASFRPGARQAVFARLESMYRDGTPISTDTLAAELMESGELAKMGGLQFLVDVSRAAPTTIEANHFIGKLREQAALRQLLDESERIGRAVKEYGGHSADDLEAFLEETKIRIERIGAAPPTSKPKSLADFSIPPEGDNSVLLGNRYLNRGDGGVISSTSSMGKSSMSLQMAVMFALGLDFHGIKPNGKLKSLIIQSEDSEGDIAEVWVSLVHRLKLTPEEVEQVKANVIIVTDRTHRGQEFIAQLRQHIAREKPDLVWINPLQAFMDGDVTDSKDLGTFLRSGLNSLNDPPTFGYIIVHHTTKPATGKDAKERLWHEVMYDMAGGAEIINWARFIMSLRATEEQGKFNLVLAKRGTRAGVTVTKEVAQGAGTRLEVEIITTISMQHASEQIVVQGHKRKLNVIFWERRDQDPKKNAPGQGRKKSVVFGDFIAIYPRELGKAMSLAELHRIAIQIRPISATALFNLTAQAVEEGLVIRDNSNPRRPVFYLKVP